MMDIDLFLLIPLALIWDLFVRKQEMKNARKNTRDSGSYIKGQIITVMIFGVFALLFIITYFLLNHHLDIDQIKNTAHKIAETVEKGEFKD